MCAPAGAGKTQAVASWLRAAELPGPVAWVSVERGAHDASQFWGAVLGALRAGGALAEQAAPEALAYRSESQEVVEQLEEGLERAGAPVLLVVDDLHELRAPEAWAGLAALVAARVPTLRLLLSSRIEPRLGLHRLRAAGEVAELSGEDLAFTPEEAGELFARAGLEIADDDVARLYERTQGWAAGLRMAAMALVRWPDPDRFVAEFSGSERTVADYLMREVLAGRPPGVRAALLRTSVLERVNGPLAHLLGGEAGGQRMLRELEDANAFVASGDVGRTWFRYHPLLREFLRGELESEAPGEVEGLHRAAAHWHARHGDAVEAIRHAQAGRHWMLTVDLLMDHWSTLYLDGRQGDVHALLTALPPEVVRSNADLAVVVAADRLAAGYLADADAFLALAERLAPSVPAGRRARFDVSLAVVTLLAARTRGDFEAAADGARALLAPVGPHLDESVGNDDVRAVALVNLGTVELWAWRLNEAESHLAEGIALARNIDRPYVVLTGLGAAAETAFALQRPRVAEERALEAVRLAESLACSHSAVAGVAYSVLGAVMLGMGRIDDAEGWLELAARSLGGVHDVAASAGLRFRLGLLRMAQGRYARAAECFAASTAAHRTMPGRHYASGLATTWELRARLRAGDAAPARSALDAASQAERGAPEWRALAAELHLAGGDPAGALGVLAPVLDGAVPVFHPAMEAEALLLQAAAHDRLHRPSAAEESLVRALGIAERLDWRACLHLQPAVRPLFARYVQSAGTPSPFVASLAEGLGATTAGVVPATLSARELDVLRLLPTNLSAGELARELDLSVHTVKTHIRSIYAKLGVHRRSEAVERSRELAMFGRPSNRG